MYILMHNPVLVILESHILTCTLLKQLFEQGSKLLILSHFLSVIGECLHRWVTLGLFWGWGDIDFGLEYKIWFGVFRVLIEA